MIIHKHVFFGNGKKVELKGISNSGQDNFVVTVLGSDEVVYEGDHIINAIFAVEKECDIDNYDIIETFPKQMFYDFEHNFQKCIGW